MYDIIFIPYRQQTNINIVPLIERVACLNPPRPNELPWILAQEHVCPREQGTILIVWHEDRTNVFRAYWYEPTENILTHRPHPLPLSTPSPSLAEKLAISAVGERGEKASGERLSNIIEFSLNIRDVFVRKRIRKERSRV